jgi:hypothetical protein
MKFFARKISVVNKINAASWQRYLDQIRLAARAEHGAAIDTETLDVE